MTLPNILPFIFLEFPPTLRRVIDPEVNRHGHNDHAIVHACRLTFLGVLF
jgi:hypothetical protein